MDARDVLFGLHELSGIGWMTMLKLIREVEPLTRVLDMNERELISLGLRRDQAQTIVQTLHETFVETKRNMYNQRGIEILTIVDEHYPDLLKQTMQPPWVLYGIGQWAKLSMPSIAIVGTRTPTVYGKKVTLQLSSALAAAGLSIVSGMARGIDGCAHEGALSAGGSTVAVLGCPLDRIYPPEHTGLFHEIARRGLVISEYPLGTAMKKGMFPMRNRIIAGIGLGTVVVEAAQKSGSLLTAMQAMDESRDVFAVPGPITSPKSAGVNQLLKDGTAKIVLSYEDIIEEYRRVLISGVSAHPQPAKPSFMLTEDERQVYDYMSLDPVTVDELVGLTQFTFGHLHSVLLSLITKKLIQPVHGSAYITT
ncbi:DNA-processing protein DprA [Paenibacillus chartarius]|uniref:DNA-processing protein DprA n=1 Tax=Paenibacillus chartarius TaxID=747481 RepID=A0ABV6DNV3_9BACL